MHYFRKSSLKVIASIALAAPSLCAPFARAQAPAVAEITDLSRAVEAIPKEAVMGLHSSKKDAAVLQATEALQKEIQGHEGTFKFKLERIEKDDSKNPGEERYRLKAEDVHINKTNNHFLAHLWIHLNPSESAKVAGLKRGAPLTATGKITLASAHFTPPNELHLQIDLSEAVLR